MLSKLFTATMQGLNAIPVTMEVNCSDSTMPHFIIVGLPDNAVKESQERVLSALNVNGYNVPVKKTVVNLAPADVRKEGSGFDLPMAIGLMMALEKLDFENPEQYMFIGELGLDGTILPVKGALPISIKARSMGLKALFVPVENAREAAVVDRLEVYGVHHICEVIDILNGCTGTGGNALSPGTVQNSGILAFTGCHGPDNSFRFLHGILVHFNALQIHTGQLFKQGAQTTHFLHVLQL